MTECIKKHGKALPKETWEQAANGLAEAAPLIAKLLLQISQDGQGETAAEEFTAHMQLAVAAMQYIANFARDKCLIVVSEDLRK